MDANKTAGEETRWQLHKNAACNPEQVLAATPHKTPTVRPPAPITKTIQVRRTRHDMMMMMITVLGVTKSLCGFVSNQAQNNMESAQYLG